MKTRNHRPWGVTVLAVLVLITAMLNILRSWQTIQQREILVSIAAYLPWYLLATGVVWAAVGLAAFFGLWFGKAWAPLLTILSAVVFAVVYWVDRLWLSIDPKRIAAWPFALALTILLLGVIIGVLSTRRAKDYFKPSEVTISTQA